MLSRRFSGHSGRRAASSANATDRKPTFILFLMTSIGRRADAFLDERARHKLIAMPELAKEIRAPPPFYLYQRRRFCLTLNARRPRFSAAAQFRAASRDTRHRLAFSAYRAASILRDTYIAAPPPHYQTRRRSFFERRAAPSISRSEIPHAFARPRSSGAIFQPPSPPSPTRQHGLTRCAYRPLFQFSPLAAAEQTIFLRHPCASADRLRRRNNIHALHADGLISVSREEMMLVAAISSMGFDIYP